MTASAKARELGRFAEFGWGPIRGVTLPEALEKVHPFQTSGEVERKVIHLFDPEIKSKGTYLKSEFLRQPMRLASFGNDAWRRHFYKSSLVTTKGYRKQFSPAERLERDRFMELAEQVVFDEEGTSQTD
jgi:hypothetical protein